jgi:hypothetical protein
MKFQFDLTSMTEEEEPEEFFKLVSIDKTYLLAGQIRC